MPQDQRTSTTAGAGEARCQPATGCGGIRVSGSNSSLATTQFGCGDACQAASCQQTVRIYGRSLSRAAPEAQPFQRMGFVLEGEGVAGCASTRRDEQPETIANSGRGTTRVERVLPRLVTNFQFLKIKLGFRMVSGHITKATCQTTRLVSVFRDAVDRLAVIFVYRKHVCVSCHM